jgi:phosphatidylglycerophosphate synthase
VPELLTDGERWTRAELERLLGARFSPRAIADFLRASLERSAQVRRERPELARQSRRWLAAGAAAYLVAPVENRHALAWWTATGLMLDWHLGMVETHEGEPQPLGPADALTLTRAWLVPVAAHDPTPFVCAAAGLTDVLDGAAARATQPTRAGRDLEGVVDFVFAAAALHGLQRTNRLPRGLVAVEIARVTTGFAYALIAYFGRAERPDDDRLHAARATTVLRGSGVVAAAAGRRRVGTALLATGSAASVALLLRRPRPRTSASPAS